MEIVEGNLLDIQTGIIVHQCNCLGVMGRGIALQIKSKYPSVFKSYHKLCTEHLKVGTEHSLLGTVQIVPVKECPPIRVANLFGQVKYGGTAQHTNYDAFENGLKKLKLTNFKRLPVYFPYGIGCGLGGGDWNIIYEIIQNTIPDSKICKLKI